MAAIQSSSISRGSKPLNPPPQLPSPFGCHAPHILASGFRYIYGFQCFEGWTYPPWCWDAFVIGESSPNFMQSDMFGTKLTPITWRQFWCYSVCYTPSSDFRHTQMSIERIKSSSKLWRRSVQEWPEWPKQTTTVVLQEALDFYGFSRSIYLRYPPVHQYSCSMQMYEYKRLNPRI